MKLLEALEMVCRHGFLLDGHLPTPGGGMSLRNMTPEDAYDLSTDQEAFASKHLNCSREEYREWLEFEGAPRCAAETKSGRLCENQLSPGGISIRHFLELHRSDYCKIHS